MSIDPKAKYTTLWTFRGIMLLRMEQAGMKSLPLGRISVAKFVKMNPVEGDAKEHGHLEIICLLALDSYDILMIFLNGIPTHKLLGH